MRGDESGGGRAAPGAALALCMTLAALTAIAAPLQAQDHAAPPAPGAGGHGRPGGGREAELIPVPAPPFSDGIFPCSDCHAQGEEVDTKRIPDDQRYHSEIAFEHAPETRWCFDCHDAKDRDRLHLADGRPVEFTRSYELCGQCHGPKLRDWKAGDHGKRTGSWSGKKDYLLCVHCHNPHSPRFKPLKPMPPPTRPEEVR